MNLTASDEQAVVSLHLVAAGPGWIVVDKPCGPAMHGEPDKDLVAMVQKTLTADAQLRDQVKQDPSFGLHPVHRLDRETSGLVLLSCQRDVFRWFSKQFEQGHVDKRYLALVHGQMEPDTDSIVWDHALSHRPGGRDNPAGTEPRVAARTRIQVLARSQHYTMLLCSLETGRKHQIRRHAALTGHPVVGDRRYTSARAIRFLDQLGFDRLALHSANLAIALPGQKQKSILPSAPLPDVILKLFTDDGGSLDWLDSIDSTSGCARQRT